MAQYFDKADLVAEIEKLKLCTMDEHMNYYSTEAQGEYNALSKLKSLLDTLEVKEVDLEKHGKELMYAIQKTHERTKREVINKACEYLESSLKHDLGYHGAADFADTFKKAMEE